MYYPYCAEPNQNYPDAPWVDGPYPLNSVENCTKDCLANANCEAYLMETSEDWETALTCELRGDPGGAAATDINEVCPDQKK